MKIEYIHESTASFSSIYFTTTVGTTRLWREKSANFPALAALLLDNHVQMLGEAKYSRVLQSPTSNCEVCKYDSEGVHRTDCESVQTCFGETARIIDAMIFCAIQPPLILRQQRQAWLQADSRLTKSYLSSRCLLYYLKASFTPRRSNFPLEDLLPL